MSAGNNLGGWVSRGVFMGVGGWVKFLALVGFWGMLGVGEIVG